MIYSISYLKPQFHIKVSILRSGIQPDLNYRDKTWAFKEIQYLLGALSYFPKSFGFIEILFFYLEYFYGKACGQVLCSNLDSPGRGNK